MDNILQVQDIDAEEFAKQLESLVYYQNILQQECMQLYIDLLYEIENGDETQMQLAYGSWNRSLIKNSANQSWAFWLIEQMIASENPFHRNYIQNEQWKSALQREIRVLFLAMRFDGKTLAKSIMDESQVYLSVYDMGQLLPKNQKNYNQNFIDFVEALWQSDTPNFALIQDFYQREGYGIAALYPLMQVEEYYLRGLLHTEWSKFDEAEIQKQASFTSLEKAIQNVITGKEKENIVLRTKNNEEISKSLQILIKKHHRNGLRIITCSNKSIPSLPLLLQDLEISPHHFFLYFDPLTLANDEEAQNHLASVLERTIPSLPENIHFLAASALGEDMSAEDKLFFEKYFPNAIEI